MKNDIRTKLAKEFKERIYTERQVVYILVETRKLMELEGIKPRYDVLTFCCNWAVHAMLELAFSQKVIAIFDDYQTSLQRVLQRRAGNRTYLLFLDSPR
jgi:hypothetical protein